MITSPSLTLEAYKQRSLDRTSTVHLNCLINFSQFMNKQTPHNFHVTEIRSLYPKLLLARQYTTFLLSVRKSINMGSTASIWSVFRNPKYLPLTLLTPCNVDSIFLSSQWLHLVVLPFTRMLCIVIFLNGSLVSELSEILYLFPVLPCSRLGFM